MTLLSVPEPEILSPQVTNNSFDSNGSYIVHRAETSHDGNYIILGKKKFLKDEVVAAFGGSMNPGISPISVHKFGNPAPLGLSAFALTIFVMGLVQTHAMGVKNTNIVIGLACFYGGLIQLLTGMWEMSLQNTFAAASLTSYGGFWIVTSSVKIPFFNISSTYATETELNHALGFMYLGWFLFNFMLTLCTLKSTVALVSFYVFFDIYLLLLTISYMGNSTGVLRSAGVIGIITAFLAWYNAYAGVSNPQNAYITASAIQLPVYGDLN